MDATRESNARRLGTQHIDPVAWSPLIYNFRHYFGLGPELGHSFRSQTSQHGQHTDQPR
jgi:hypothetical protein